ncbi:hypothetical protein BGZ81_003152 [Podila clonocystis]|nr:hypothetical protein BGZ81_003152 [Podila clonocystis]
MIKGGALFYDGMKSKKLQWLVSNKKGMTIPEGFQMSQVWYLKKNVQGDLGDQQELVSLDMMANPTTAPSRPLTSVEEKDEDEHSGAEDSDAGAIDQTAASQVPIFERKKRKGKPRYPIGLSLGVVGGNGRFPKCAGCGQIMNRGCQRLLLRRVTNKIKGWTTETSFHIEGDCISAMDWANQIQAQSLISPNANPMNGNQSSTIEKQRARCRTALRDLTTSLGAAWTPTLSRRSGR